MKFLIVAIAVICLLSCTHNMAKDTSSDCDTKYTEMMERMKDSPEISPAEKSDFMPQFEKAMQYCKEGNKAEESKIMEDLKEDIAFQKVFGTDFSH